MRTAWILTYHSGSVWENLVSEPHILLSVPRSRGATRGASLPSLPIIPVPVSPIVRTAVLVWLTVWQQAARTNISIEAFPRKLQLYDFNDTCINWMWIDNVFVFAECVFLKCLVWFVQSVYLCCMWIYNIIVLAAFVLALFATGGHTLKLISLTNICFFLIYNFFKNEVGWFLAKK